MGLFRRKKNPDVETLAMAFGRMIDEFESWKKSGLSETVLFMNCLESAYGVLGKGNPFDDDSDDIAYFIFAFMENRARHDGVHMNLLKSLNKVLGNRDLRNEEMRRVIELNLDKLAVNPKDLLICSVCETGWKKDDVENWNHIERDCLLNGEGCPGCRVQSLSQ